MAGVEASESNVGVLDKVMSILYAFPRGDVALTPQEIAAHTNLPLPTVYRLAQALCTHGLLMKDGPRFRLGMRLLHLGAMVADGIDLRWRALPHLRWLKEQTGENAELHIRYEETRIAVEIVRSPHNLRSFFDIGEPLPLHLGGGGKVLLAWLPAEEQEALIAASLTRFGGSDAFDVRAFQGKLERVRTRGWAFSEGERARGVSSLAAPIFDVIGQVVGALVLAAPTLRLGSDEQAAYIPLVCEAAKRTSYDLGYIEREEGLSYERDSPREGNTIHGE